MGSRSPLAAEERSVDDVEMPEWGPLVGSRVHLDFTDGTGVFITSTLPVNDMLEDIDANLDEDSTARFMSIRDIEGVTHYFNIETIAAVYVTSETLVGDKVKKPKRSPKRTPTPKVKKKAPRPNKDRTDG
jgi:hypothetical protein